MEFKSVVLFGICTILVICLNVSCYTPATDPEDLKVVFNRYNSSLCLAVENLKTTPTATRTTPTVVLRTCTWKNIPSGMKVSVHPLEEVEDTEKQVSATQLTNKTKDAFIIRIIGASCLITGSDNYSIKTGKCNTINAFYSIKIIPLVKLNKIIPTTTRAPVVTSKSSNHTNHSANKNHSHAYQIKQGELCMTMQKKHDNTYSAVMVPCLSDNKDQIWTVCTPGGDCTNKTNALIHIPSEANLHKNLTLTTTEMTTTTEPTTTTEVTTEPSTTTTTTEATTPATTKETSTTEKKIDVVEKPMSCKNPASNKSNCVAKSSASSNYAYGKLEYMLMFLCIASRII